MQTEPIHSEYVSPFYIVGLKSTEDFMFEKICKKCGEVFYVKYKKEFLKRQFCCAECANLYRRKKNKYVFHDDFVEIILTNRKKEKFSSFIDKEDYEKIKGYYWMPHYHAHVKGYYAYSVKTIPQSERKDKKCQEIFRLHRFVMDCPKDKVIDHINHNTLDNRKSNLRICTQYENMQNLSLYSTNKSGVKNISYQKTAQGRKKWIVTMIENGKNKTVGRGLTLEDAIKIKEDYLKNKNGTL